MPKGHVIVLADEREDCCGKITLKGKPRYYALVHRLIAGKQYSDGEFQPRSFWTLARMVKPRQLGCLKACLEPWLRYEFYQSDSLNATCVLARQTLKCILYVRDCVLRQFSLDLVLDLYCHSVEVLRSISLGNGNRAVNVG